MISMSSCVSKPLEEEDTQSKIELHDHADIPARYASLESVYSVSSSSSSLCCISAAGSHKKVNAQKHSMSDALQGYGRAGDLESLPHRRPEIVHVYCRRKRKRRRRRESFVELAIAQNEGVDSKAENVKIESAELDEEEEKKMKPKKRRIGNGELMKLGVDSTTLSIFNTPHIRGCRMKAVCSGSKQNGSSRSKKNVVKNQEKVVSASATAKKWVRLGFTYHLFCWLGTV